MSANENGDPSAIISPLSKLHLRGKRYLFNKTSRHTYDMMNNGSKGKWAGLLTIGANGRPYINTSVPDPEAENDPRAMNADRPIGAGAGPAAAPAAAPANTLVKRIFRGKNYFINTKTYRAYNVAANGSKGKYVGKLRLGGPVGELYLNTSYPEATGGNRKSTRKHKRRHSKKTRKH